MKRFKIKEIHSWLNQLPENKWRKIYKVDAKRVAYFVNHGSNATLPVTLSRKFGDASFLRELQLAKNFVLHKIDEKRKLEGKSNNPITEDVEMHTISGNKRFMTKTALPILKKHGIKNVKVNDVAGDFLEIRFPIDSRKLKELDKELKRKNKRAYGGIIEGRYHQWRNDDSKTPKQKIGMAMRETRDNLTELERMVNYNVKLKNELKVDSRDYWKNTHKALSKISERLVRLANKVGQLH